MNENRALFMLKLRHIFIENEEGTDWNWVTIRKRR